MVGFDRKRNVLLLDKNNFKNTKTTKKKTICDKFFYHFLSGISPKHIFNDVTENNVSSEKWHYWSVFSKQQLWTFIWFCRHLAYQFSQTRGYVSS